jgi:actin-related protein
MSITSIVIENGSYETRAGFSLDELPQLAFPSVYSRDNNGTISIGDEHPQDNEVLTILNDGVVYNWDALEANWRHVYESLHADPREQPLVITEEIWNNKRNRTKLCELAFDKLQVPVFAIVKNPLAVTYGVGRSTSLVVDIGAATTSVTPILDGTVLYKGAVHSKFAGDFLSLHIHRYLSQFLPLEAQFQGSDSYRRLQATSILDDFKSTILSVSGFPIVHSQTEFNINPLHYELPNGQRIEVGKEQVLLSEPLFLPQNYRPQGMELPQDSLGLTELILSALKKLDVSNEIYNALLSNIVFTGGTSLIPGLEQRILSDLTRFLPQYHIQSFSNPVVLERANAVWLGASILANMSSFETQYLGRDEYLQRGQDAVSAAFK